MLKWVFCIVVTLAILAGCWDILKPPPTHAHDWYPWECCSGNDCYEVDEKDIQELSWDDVVDKKTGQHFTGNQVRVSPDGKWHLCTGLGKRDGRPICAFRPTPGF